MAGGGSGSSGSKSPPASTVVVEVCGVALSVGDGGASRRSHPCPRLAPSTAACAICLTACIDRRSPAAAPTLPLPSPLSLPPPPPPPPPRPPLADRRGAQYRDGDGGQAGQSPWEDIPPSESSEEVAAAAAAAAAAARRPPRAGGRLDRGRAARGGGGDGGLVAAAADIAHPHTPAEAPSSPPSPPPPPPPLQRPLAGSAPSDTGGNSVDASDSEQLPSTPPPATDDQSLRNSSLPLLAPLAVWRR